MSSFGLSIAYKKAVRAPDVSWMRHKDVPWNVTLERLENNKTARTPGHRLSNEAISCSSLMSYELSGLHITDLIASKTSSH
ncbi:hypothetical protein M422DRAFT_258654 [Sphaerobolus stellatus SS14]|uniref:Uncharacterized protein n=1 Tax=Sphaerobolus stellatus (strain SS14) TaxID=990650 RepID=A0A0C9VB64_SPHS4|nr:hypothetical protein M422DRAFT_258654 [Sphaerobolus stellatus SS14]